MQQTDDVKFSVFPYCTQLNSGFGQFIADDQFIIRYYIVLNGNTQSIYCINHFTFINVFIYLRAYCMPT